MERVALITGANTGIGYETARGMASVGYNVLMGCRDANRGAAARDRLISELPPGCPQPELAVFDLADLCSVGGWARRTLDGGELRALDVLVLNAGVMAPPLQRTAQGHELQFGVNHLAHFLLARELLPLLLAAAAEAAVPRVVAVASMAAVGGRLDFADLDWRRRRYSRWAAYCDSKLANVLFARQLATREPRLAANSLHPGVVASELARHILPDSDAWWRGPLVGALGAVARTPAQGAATSLHLATAPEAGLVSGEYFTGPGKASKLAGGSASAAARLWQVSQELCEGY